MRLFLCIFPDDQTRSYFRDVKQQLAKFKRNINFVDLDQIHLTIRFLGNDVSEETYEFYTEQFGEYVTQVKEFDYKIEKLSVGFKGQNTKDIIIANIKPNDSLNQLNEQATLIAKQFSPYDIVTTKERKAVMHHMTVGRIKTDKSRVFVSNLNEKIKEMGVPSFLSRAKTVVAVQSVLTSKGPIYKKLKEWNLVSTNNFGTSTTSQI